MSEDPEDDLDGTSENQDPVVANTNDRDFSPTAKTHPVRSDKPTTKLEKGKEGDGDCLILEHESTQNVPCKVLKQEKDDCLILEHIFIRDAPSTSLLETATPAPSLSSEAVFCIKTKPNVPHIRTVQLSHHPISKTILIVAASNQRNIAPVIVPLADCSTFDSLFDTLIAECEIEPESAGKVTKISAKNTWDGRSMRIRRERSEDWQFFWAGLCRAWEEEGKEWEVEMMLHVDE